MKRSRIRAMIAAAFAAVGACSAQTGSASDRGWSQMMMGPMAGCPMGAAGQGMMGPFMMGPDMMQGGMMSGRMMDYWDSQEIAVDPQLEALRSSLAIQPTQEDAWKTYVATARADAQTMSDMHTRMVTFMRGGRGAAPDWLNVHRDMMKARLESLDSLSAAVAGLYAQLDASQRATFDRYGGGMCGAW